MFAGVKAFGIERWFDIVVDIKTFIIKGSGGCEAGGVGGVGEDVTVAAERRGVRYEIS